MKQKTLLLFQLLLAVYAFYSVVTYTNDLKLWVPLFCLIGMFIISKMEAKATKGGTKAAVTSQAIKAEGPGKQAFNPLECLLKSKNVLLLTDAIHQLLRDLGLEVIRSPRHNGLERIVRLPGSQLTLGLKILSDIKELSPEWDKWEALLFSRSWRTRKLWPSPPSLSLRCTSFVNRKICKRARFSGSFTPTRGACFNLRTTPSARVRPLSRASVSPMTRVPLRLEKTEADHQYRPWAHTLFPAQFFP